MKTFDPPLSSLAGHSITGTRRFGKMLCVDFSDELSLLIHLMHGGRMTVFDKRASLRELLASDQVVNDEMVATLGPEALPPPAEQLAELVRSRVTRTSRESAVSHNPAGAWFFHLSPRERLAHEGYAWSRNNGAEGEAWT